MKPKISIITLGVKNLPSSIDFYKKLGFRLETEENTDSIAFFIVEGASARLALFPAEELAKDANIPMHKKDTSSYPGFTLAHNVPSEEEVEKVLHEAVAMGATLVKPGQKVFWGGYSGYFADPDGFLWEVCYNPFMDLT